MLQIIKIFVIVVICSVFTIIIASAQDKKVFDNVGVYFGPMQDLRDIGSLNFIGVFRQNIRGGTIGLKSNVELNDRWSINMGFNFGIIGYKMSKYLVNGTNITNFGEATLYANMIKSDINIQYSVFTTNNNNSFFLLGGPVLIKHFREDIVQLNSLIFRSEKLRFFNKLFEIGLGYDLTVSSSFSIKTNLYVGLPVWKNKAELIPHYDFTYNNIFGINLGLISIAS